MHAIVSVFGVKISVRDKVMVAGYFTLETSLLITVFLPHYSIDSAIVFDHYNDTVTIVLLVARSSSVLSSCFTVCPLRRYY